MTVAAVELLRTRGELPPVARPGQIMKKGDRYQVICPASGNVLIDAATDDFLVGEIRARRLRLVVAKSRADRPEGTAPK